MARVIRAVAPRSAIRGATLLGGRPKAGPPRHFLDVDQYETGDLHSIIDLGVAYKNGRHDRPLEGKMLAMIFEKPSTRTRVSFEVAMRQLGGDTIVIGAADSQLGRGETMADTARVLSRYVDAIMMRTNHAEKLADLARHATVPVINGLTDSSHPCQIMADVMTLQEKKGPVADTVVAWSGDGKLLRVIGAHHDRVNIARQHPRRVGHRLAAAKLAIGGADHDRVAAELAHRDLEGDAGAGRRFLEDHRQHLAFERPVVPAVLIGDTEVDDAMQIAGFVLVDVEEMARRAGFRPAPEQGGAPNC